MPVIGSILSVFGGSSAPPMFVYLFGGGDGVYVVCFEGLNLVYTRVQCV